SIRCCAVVLLLRRRPRSTPFPYTTLFRSDQAQISRFRWPRAVLALSVGFSLTTLAVFALAARDGMAVAALLPDAAYHLGHGANTVNVILVDIRAWDTMGEIMVLVVAATGVASMVFRHRRFGSPPRVSDAGQPDIGRIAQFVDISPAVGDITWLR